MPSRGREPVWVERLVVDAVHLDLIRTHGGLAGLRDENALESALARPRHRWSYARDVRVETLAAAYGYGLAHNHPYRDGNKRVAFLVMLVFLGLNGYDLEAPEGEVVATMVRLAAGDLTEAALARWLRQRVVPYREP